MNYGADTVDSWGLACYVVIGSADDLKIEQKIMFFYLMLVFCAIDHYTTTLDAPCVFHRTMGSWDSMRKYSKLKTNLLCKQKQAAIMKTQELTARSFHHIRLN